MRNSNWTELGIPSIALTLEMVLEGTVTLSLETEVSMTYANTMAPRKKVLLRAHWNQGQSLLQERNQRHSTILPMAQAGIFTSSGTMVWKQIIEVSIATLKEDCARVHPHQIWMLAICVKRTHGDQMQRTIRTGPLCKPLNKTTRYLMSRDAALKDFLHPNTLLVHKVPIYWNLHSQFQSKSLCQKYSLQEIRDTLRKGEIVSISLRLVLFHSRLSQIQLTSKTDSTQHSNGNMTVRDSLKSKHIKMIYAKEVRCTWRHSDKLICNQSSEQKLQVLCFGKKLVAKWIILWTSSQRRLRDRIHIRT